MQPKLIVNFDRLGEAEFQRKVGVIIAAMTANPKFPEPWPAPAPGLAALSEALNSYRTACNACLTRDIVRIHQRQVTRQTLTEMLKRLMPYLEFVANGDVMALASTGFDLRRDTSRSGSSELLAAPDGFKVQHGQRSGSVDLRVNSLSGAISFEIQTAQGDPTLEANWKHILTAPPRTRITLSDLPPRQDFWIRMRGVGINGSGLWTEPVHIIVV
jgi:hypothetical protein